MIRAPEAQEQCWPNNIVALCFQQPVTAYNFWRRSLGLL